MCVFRGNVTTSSTSPSYLTTISLFLVLEEIENVTRCGKSDQEHLDEDDAAPELPIVENGQPGELVEADKLLASTSIPHLGANISLHDQMLGSCIYQQDIRL